VNDDGTLTVSAYTHRDTYVLPLANLRVGSKDRINNTVFFAKSDDDLRISLLERGMVELVDPSVATPEERRAQESAKRAGSGLWSLTDAPPEPPEARSLRDRVRSGFAYLRERAQETASIVVSSGVALWMIQTASRRRHERKVNALVVGLAGVGKSAFVQAWRDADIGEADLLNVPPTITRSTVAHRRPILAGRYEIYPNVTDTPGSKPGVALDAILQRTANPLRKQILIVVLSPAQSNQETTFDQSFIMLQEGFVTGFIVALLTAQEVKRPALVIAYISKFDLFSTTPPRDSASASPLQAFQVAFRPHLSALKQACDREGVRFTHVIGSSVRRWGVRDVGTEIKEALYS
jgi:hypothetical protein